MSRSSTFVDVAVIGAGPYGLSLAAHLRRRAVEHRIFGEPMGAPSPKSEHLSVPAQPLAVRLTTLMAILLLAIGLATGFFRTLAMTAPSVGRTGWRPIQDILRRRWRDSRIVVLTMFAFGFPVSVAFRLTIGGWEIGNRMLLTRGEGK